MPVDLSAHPRLLVACLCAEWCGACREYRRVFAEASSGDEARDERWMWIDVEDHAEVLDDIEIETFPTLLIGDEDGAVFFFGDVTPQGQVLRRLAASARSGELKRLSGDEVIALAGRIRAHR